MGIFGFDVLDFSQLTLPCVHPDFAVVQIVPSGKKGQSGLSFVPVTTNWPESRLASNVALSLVLAWWRALIKMAAWYLAIQTKKTIQQLRLSMASMVFSPMGIMVSKAYHPYEWCLSPTYNSYHSYAWSFWLYFYPCCHRFQFLPTLPFPQKNLLWNPELNDIVQLIPYRSDKPSIWPACFNYPWCCVVKSCEQCTCIFSQVDLHSHPDCQVALSRSAWQYLCQHPEMLQGLWPRCVVFGRMQPNDKINVTLAKREWDPKDQTEWREWDFWNEVPRNRQMINDLWTVRLILVFVFLNVMPWWSWSC